MTFNIGCNRFRCSKRVKQWVSRILHIYEFVLMMTISVTQRMLELEKEVGSLKRSNETVIREKDSILNKSAHLVIIDNRRQHV